MASLQSTVLAVDDKQTNLEILAGMLKSAGYSVVTATDGVEAWNILEQRGGDFEAILLDRIMPNMNGLEVLEKIKAHPGLQSIPVIMQTSAGAAHEVLEGIQAGAFYYLTKPYKKKILLGIVQAALRDFASHQSLQEELRQNARTWSFLDSGIFRFRTLGGGRHPGWQESARRPGLRQRSRRKSWIFGAGSGPTRRRAAFRVNDARRPSAYT